MNTYILDCLHQLLAHNVIGDKQYSSRYKGFKGELDFLSFFRQRQTKAQLYTGGYFLPTQEGQHTLNLPVYFTINTDTPNDKYVAIYRQIAQINCLKMFYIQYDNHLNFDTWPMIDIMNINTPLPVPHFNVYEYQILEQRFVQSTLSKLLQLYQKTTKTRKNLISQSTKNQYIQLLKEYSVEDLIQLYVNRLVFDGYLGFACNKGIPSDIDAIICQNGQFRLIEIKEKDKSKKPPQGFGMDIGRIDSLQTISLRTAWPCYYLVKEINNQQQRQFIAWHWINLCQFIAATANVDTIEGGTGMRSLQSSNPTKVCPYHYFHRF